MVKVIRKESKKKARPFPTAEQLLKFIAAAERVVTKQDICRRFNIKGDDRRRLRRLIVQMKGEGLILPQGSNQYVLPKAGVDTPPDTFEVRVVGIEEYGEPYCEVMEKKLRGLFPLLILDPKADVGIGDVVTAQFSQMEPGVFLGDVIRKHENKKQDKLVGVLKDVNDTYAQFQCLHPELAAVPFLVEKPAKELKDGQVVLAVAQSFEQSGRSRKSSATPVVVEKVLGDNTFGLESTIAILAKGIPHIFPDEVIKENEDLPAFDTSKDLGQRDDLRHIPMVTIDGADAKDFDDAVWAEETKDGFHIIVAIADVAHYIKELGALDTEALNRGNSTYFPDKVVPMLPERLCNDLCSLRPHEDRPVLAVHMHVNPKGHLVKYEFVRAVIHSHARLIYEQVEEAIKGNFDDVTKGLWDKTLEPLYKAYKTLLKAREKRGALDLDVPETKIMYDDDNNPVEIGVRERLESHKLIEEMMVLANVATAMALNTKGAPCLYRVHPEPSMEKLNNLESVLKSHNLRLGGGNVSPERIQHLIDTIRDRKEAPALMQSILRSQSQAQYDPTNIGHFGLGLTHYAHFTSPIRRYSDLVVHRALVKYLKLAGGGAMAGDGKDFKNIGEHLCITERRSQRAEWDARDRIVAALFHDEVGREFDAVVMSVQQFGMFVSINGGLAEGLVPVRLMSDDHYTFNGKTSSLYGKRTKKQYRIGSAMKVKLKESDPISAKLTFEPSGLKNKRKDGGRSPFKGAKRHPKKS